MINVNAEHSSAFSMFQNKARSTKTLRIEVVKKLLNALGADQAALNLSPAELKKLLKPGSSTDIILKKYAAISGLLPKVIADHYKEMNQHTTKLSKK